jgi:hypothetical protein
MPTADPEQRKPVIKAADMSEVRASRAVATTIPARVDAYFG